VPASFYLRLRHQPFRSRPARLSLRREAEAAVLQLEYADVPRRLVIRFDPAFPHRIFGWEETDAGKVMSRGRLVATVMAPYWTQHGNADEPLRDTLGLRF
jgi:hypothetical protein